MSRALQVDLNSMEVGANQLSWLQIGLSDALLGLNQREPSQIDGANGRQRDRTVLSDGIWQTE